MQTILEQIQAGIQHGPCFFSFTYNKENGETSERLVSFGVNVGKAFEKRGIEIKGTGNWHKGCTGGHDGMIIERQGELYLRGLDMGDNVVKIFKVSGINNLGKKT